MTVLGVLSPAGVEKGLMTVFEVLSPAGIELGQAFCEFVVVMALEHVVATA
jgi:hypothetical protein